jgi:hypothetical protein
MTLNGVPPTLHMVQGDTNSRAISASLWAGAEPYNVPAGASVMLRFKKPDGTGGLYSETETQQPITWAENSVTIPVAAQVLTAEGTVLAQVDVYAGESDSSAERLASFAFMILVQPDVYPDAQIISSDYYNILAADIADAKAAADQAKDYAAAAKKSADSAATSVEGAVKYNTSQTLTDAQKAQARANIGAPAPYTAGDGISISGSVIATKVQPCNRNLLDNWYFGAPVNQRDVSGTISSAGYFLDRWKLVSGSVTISADGITLNGTMQQVLETAPVGTVTASAMTQAGVGEVVPTYDSASKTVTVTADGKKLVAVKLEIGPQQTLAHQEDGVWVLNEIPDYGEELTKCMRYLQVLAAPYDTSGNGVAIGYANNTVDLWVPIPLAVPMRISPTPAIPTGGAALLKVGKTSGSPKDVTRVTGGWAMQTGGACSMRSLIFTSSGLTAGETYALFMQQGAQIVLSAEL